MTLPLSLPAPPFSTGIERAGHEAASCSPVGYLGVTPYCGAAPELANTVAMQGSGTASSTAPQKAWQSAELTCGVLLPMLHPFFAGLVPPVSRYPRVLEQAAVLHVVGKLDMHGLCH